jgi:hypothetical protein
LRYSRRRSAHGHDGNIADVGDIWWNPNESGWGLQLSQSNTTLFATLYVYDDATFPFCGTQAR